MNKMISLITVGLAIAWLIPAMSTSAFQIIPSSIHLLEGQGAAGRQETTGQRGTVDRVDFDKNRVVIGGVTYQLTHDIRVRNADGGESEGIRQLKAGSVVEFQPELNENNQTTIKKIKIISYRGD